MKWKHIEFMLEEDSAEVALQALLPRLLPQTVTWDLHPFQGKTNLLASLPSRLRAYRKWIPSDWGIVVLMDEDRADCRALKAKMEAISLGVGFATKSAPDKTGNFQVINRLCIEELEAWFFGDVPALCAAYPGVPTELAKRRAYRNPDAIRGGTWEALERVLQSAGHHRGGLAKKQAARDITAHMKPETNNSVCFRAFRSALLSATLNSTDVDHDSGK